MKTKNNTLTSITIALIMIIVATSLGACTSKETIVETEIEMPVSASNLKGENFEDVVIQLETAGFTNIETKKLEDLITGWITKDGEVEKVSVNGKTDFQSGDQFLNDAKIVITYHTFPEKKADEPVTEAAVNEVETTAPAVDEVKSTTSAISLKGENYKDVISKLESFGFINIETEKLEDLITGWWTADGEVEKVSMNGTTDFEDFNSFPKDAKVVITYHTFPEKKPDTPATESAVTETKPVEPAIPEPADYTGKDAKAARDALVSGGYKVVLLLDAIADMDDEYEDVESDFTKKLNKAYKEGSIFLVVSQEYDKSSKSVTLYIDTKENVKKQQKKARQREKLEAKLKAYAAWAAVKMYGDYEYPYGFKLHIMGMLAEEPLNSKTWFLKATCDVTNGFGATMKGLTCEAKVKGTTNNPEVVSFYVY